MPFCVAFDLLSLLASEMWDVFYVKHWISHFIDLDWEGQQTHDPPRGEKALEMPLVIGLPMIAYRSQKGTPGHLWELNNDVGHAAENNYSMYEDDRQKRKSD